MGTIIVNSTPNNQDFIEFLNSNYQDSDETYMAVLGNMLNWNFKQHDEKFTFAATVLAWGAPMIDKELIRQSVVGSLEPVTGVNSQELISVDCLGYEFEGTNIFIAGGYPLVDVDPSQRADVYEAISHMYYPDQTRSIASDFYSHILLEDAYNKLGGLPRVGFIYSVISPEISVAHQKQALVGDLCTTAMRNVEDNSDFTSSD